MTQDEQYRVIGQTFSNYQVATKQLACLKAKSKEAAEQLDQIAALLREEKIGHHDVSGGFSIAERPHGPVHYRVPYPSEQEIAEIIKEIEATTARIKALEQQLRDLGFRE